MLPAHWERYDIIRRELADHDYMVWLDSDTVVRNMEVDLRSIISAYDDDIILSADWYVGSDYNRRIRPFPPVNTGAMVLKNTPWTHAFLSYFLSLQDPFCKRCAEKWCSGIQFHDQVSVLIASSRSIPHPFPSSTHASAHPRHRGILHACTLGIACVCVVCLLLAFPFLANPPSTH